MSGSVVFGMGGLLGDQNDVVRLLGGMLLRGLLFSRATCAFRTFAKFPNDSVVPVFGRDLVGSTVPTAPVRVTACVTTLKFDDAPAGKHFAGKRFRI